MNYTSTRDGRLSVTSAQAIARGISEEGGLFVPETLPTLTAEELQQMTGADYVTRAVTVLSNALIAIIGKMQHDTFGDTYKNEYLIVSFLGAALWLTVLGFLFERRNLRATLRHGTLYGVIAGFFNGINNLLSLVVYNYLAISIVSPMKTGLGMLLSFLIALLVYRERFTRRQWAGAAVGTVAILLMNL